jgi:hypothetical protein
VKPAINLLVITLTGIAFASGCSKPSSETVELRHYTLNDMHGVVTRSDVELDTYISSDGGGSLRIAANRPTVVRLFETGEIDVENARLGYQAKLRTENMQGKVYLEMWCHFPGKGEYFSRALDTPISGTVEWASQETPFFLKTGENPDNVKLNLVIEGSGTVWVDDIRLVQAALR